jgi:hypothetical protein
MSDKTAGWLALASDAYKRSTTYADTNYRKSWEDGLRLFHSMHPRDSKYNSDEYRYRSRVFRPKTRSVIRRHEATAMMALFANPDVLTTEPLNTADPEAAIGAKVAQALLQYRLTNSRNGIPWFVISIGAFQDAMKLGVCASLQYWDYQTRKEKAKRIAEIPGIDIPVELEVEVEVPVVDKPCCELIPIDHLHFDAASKWYDPIGTSPYVIVRLPMFVGDVLDRMESRYAWKRLSQAQILEARVDTEPDLRQVSPRAREDPAMQQSEVSDFDVVMVHLNFIRRGAECYVFYTLKDKYMLSDPVPLEKMFPTGEIPVTVGFCLIETHNPMPGGLTHLGATLQQEANEIANQRLDNVKLVLNKRWVVRRGSQIDVEGLLRNVPGGVSMANDVEKDLREVNWNDVTASSFQEQDRLNADFDDLEGGGLSSSSVMTNRRLNETVGGMRMLTQGANILTEYTFRVWVETWVEPTLRQLLKLVQYYESDETVLALAAEKAGLFKRLRGLPNWDKLLSKDLLLSVNVGMGATDPDARFQRFMQALGAYTQISAQAPPDLDLKEVKKELFGLAGFRDSARFFTQVDPRLVQAQRLLQQAEAIATKVVDSHKDRIARRERALDERETRLLVESKAASMDNTAKMEELKQKFLLDLRKQNMDFALKQREASMDAGLKAIQIQLDALKGELSKPKKRTAVRKGSGVWEISEG